LQSVFVAQRLALLGQLSSAVAKLVAEESDARKQIIVAKEVVNTSFVALDPCRIARNRVETHEHDQRFLISTAEWDEHLELLRLWKSAGEKLREQGGLAIEKQLREVDRTGTYGVLQILGAWEVSFQRLREEAAKDMKRTKTIAAARRFIEDWESTNREVLQKQHQVKIMSQARRLKAAGDDIRPIQLAYERKLKELAEAEERKKQETLAQRAAAALEDRRRQERLHVETEETQARVAAELVEHTSFEDIHNLERFSRLARRR
jgi:hypothetical protein